MKLAIVTPCLNVAEFLPDCLDSVSSQTTADLEIEHLVLDGGSDDASASIAEEHGATMLARPEGSSLFDAINIGYEAADADLIGYLGADDRFCAGALQIVATKAHDSGSPFLAGRIRWTKADFSPSGVMSPLSPRLPPTIFSALGFAPLAHIATFVTPGFFGRVGQFDTSFHYAADHDWICRARREAPHSVIRQVVTEFRRPDGPVNEELGPKYWSEIKRIEDEYAPNRYIGAARAIAKVNLYLTSPSWVGHQVFTRFKKREMSLRR